MVLTAVHCLNIFLQPFYKWGNNSVSFLVNEMAAFNCVDKDLLRTCLYGDVSSR